MREGSNEEESVLKGCEAERDGDHVDYEVEGFIDGSVPENKNGSDRVFHYLFNDCPRNDNGKAIWQSICCVAFKRNDERHGEHARDEGHEDERARLRAAFVFTKEKVKPDEGREYASEDGIADNLKGRGFHLV
ncbi:unnamed protein product [Sphagnum balticum]